MTKSAKLYARLLANPSKPIPFRQLEQIVAGFGFVHTRTTGSHRGWEHPDVPRLLVLQPRGKDAKPYQQHQFLDMVTEHQLKIEE